VDADVVGGAAVVDVDGDVAASGVDGSAGAGSSACG